MPQFNWRSLAVVVLPTLVGTASHSRSSAAEGASSRPALTQATLLEIRDKWDGLGDTHCAFVRLRRKGTEFAYDLKVSDRDVGERVPDPTSPRQEPPCICAVDVQCECEGGLASSTLANGTVPAAVVEAFLRTVSRHGIDSNQSARRGTFHTDDYPAGHVAVWLPGSPRPVHLSFLDQSRRWRMNGRYLTPDTGCKSGYDGHEEGPPHCQINRAYAALLEALGSEDWVQLIRRRSL